MATSTPTQTAFAGRIFELLPEIQDMPLENPLPEDKPSELRAHASTLAQSLDWVPNVRISEVLAQRARTVAETLNPILSAVAAPIGERQVSDDLRWLHENANLISSALQNTAAALSSTGEMPHVQTPSQTVVPRVLVLSEGFLAASHFKFTESGFAEYVSTFQEHMPLNMSEFWGLIPALKLVLLEELATRAAKVVAGVAEPQGIGICVRSLQEVAQVPWKSVIEPLIPFEKVLTQDPASAYAVMDFESRDLYRSEIVKIAENSDRSEMDVAHATVDLAREAQKKRYADPRESTRCSHIGYYLLAAGRQQLQEKVGFQPTVRERIHSFLRRHPDEFYLLTNEVLTLVLVASAVLILTTPSTSMWFIFVMMALLLLPCSQSAVEVTNYLVTSLLPPRILPKMDFSAGIPANCMTMVAVPTLLLNEQQVFKLIDDMEVRYLGNRDRNLHFALLTDLADSQVPPHQDDPLVHLCEKLIGQLNEKYAGQGAGSFFMFHRHRVYNPRERMWMGWERKRGKLLDFNDLLRGGYDSFPVKVGNLEILPQIRYVITLDADTKLPRGAAQRLVGTLAHPLNQAIIDPTKNIVVTGYGIIQPRAGVSVKSAARSRLARIYSGQTGLDIYTSASSDVYQDLYEEGSYAGKGVYEVDVLRQVLGGRFPHNALLSHDLIEGAYAGAGLASDIQIIEDYPSHYSAYNRRKHRWLRGDWQIVEWLLSTVPGPASGQRVPNPLSTISKWKILDNLRRSLVEPATFLMLVLGWLVLPGPAWLWTVVTVAILFVPAWCRLLFEAVRAVFNRNVSIIRGALTELFSANVTVFLSITFLAHQALLSTDAAIRATIRRIFTRRHMLEWETAAEAEAESGVTRRTPIDAYLDWTPAVALGVGLLLALVKPQALPAALPVLILWGCSKLISMWLNLPPREHRLELSKQDRSFARKLALRTWRYFSDFSTAEHNWLIPDNVQEDNPDRVAARLSTTNLGLLLNARQAANELGYLTVPEFASLTAQTLATVKRLQKFRGHLFNWYDTHTLEPLKPRFVSSVDNGNLVASLWTLVHGSLEHLERPLFEPSLAGGLLDCAHELTELRVLPRNVYAEMNKGLSASHWLEYLLSIPNETFADLKTSQRMTRAVEVPWLIDEAFQRLEAIKKMARTYMPWLLAEFDSLRRDGLKGLSESENLALSELPAFIARLEAQLQLELAEHKTGLNDDLLKQLLTLLPGAHRDALALVQQLRDIAADANELASQMDFGFLMNERRKLLAVGYEVEADRVTSACYDLLASEARIAAFVAIAKGEISQDLWFSLSRLHTLQQGRPILLSWSGTMFEYLMPAIWMRTQPQTLLARSQEAAVRVQRAYGASTKTPWGISESARAEKDNNGLYGYFAFGIPSLAISKPEGNATVISPYSTFLALQADPEAALQNLHRMTRMGWLGRLGFYDAADYSHGSGSWRRHYEIVRNWMAHHQGMSLLAVTNLLCDGVFQRWFHQDPRVQATELLLEEKPVAIIQPRLEKYGAPAA
jgi:cyclic beta-1,2-glucan synthetase